MIDQLSTLEVLCPRVQWIDYATSVPTEKVQYSMYLESVLGEPLQHYVMFLLSPTDLAPA